MVVLAAAWLSPSTAWGQDRLADAAACAGQRISDIVVRTRPPYPEGLLRRWQSLVRLAHSVHVTTDPDVVRRFLAFSVGQPCVPLRLAESERILRAQPFLAQAEIVALSDRAGGVRIDVETVDEFSLVVGGSARQESPYLTRLRLGDRNLMGRGASLTGEWRLGNGFFRDAWSAEFTHHQLFARPYQLSLSGARRTLGSAWRVEALHPFFTDLQRFAWRAAAGSSHEYFGFVREHAPTSILPVQRSYLDLGGLIRIGVPGRLSLFGASVSQDHEVSGTDPLFISETGLQPDESASVLIGRYGSHRTARVNALWGVRSIQFVRVRGFDALTGIQDVRRGFQLGTLFGRSLSVLGSEDDDIFLAADLYGGAGTQRLFAGMQLQGEGRQNYETNAWDGILMSGRAAIYYQPLERHTVLLEGRWSGGWRQRIPFQLTLGDQDGGVRGYRDSRAGGGQRAVVRVEERLFLGRPRRLGDMGLVAFVDAGRLWAGDVPFGIDTRTKIGVGAGLLAAVPPRSKRLWRLEIAFAASPDPHARWELRFSNRDYTRMFWPEPADIARNREPSVPSSVFNWP